MKTMLLSLSWCIVTVGAGYIIDFDYNFHLTWVLMGIGVAIYRYGVPIQQERKKSVSIPPSLSVSTGG